MPSFTRMEILLLKPGAVVQLRTNRTALKRPSGDATCCVIAFEQGCAVAANIQAVSPPKIASGATTNNPISLTTFCMRFPSDNGNKTAPLHVRAQPKASLTTVFAYLKRASGKLDQVLFGSKTGELNRTKIAVKFRITLKDFKVPPAQEKPAACEENVSIVTGWVTKIVPVLTESCPWHR